ncbi:MAG: aminoacetone oxidase family FAD-binding enzyme [Phycisphaerales bacterium]|nr:aminoacetone oxidase family FAD-binding enzyme [Phycisphaerales bacterium]
MIRAKTTSTTGVSCSVIEERCDIAVVGAGAAGLFAAIWAGRVLQDRGSSGRVVALDGAKKLGAKILVAGGGRCNVTHHAVDESAYAGSSRNAIKQVLRRFGVEQTVGFFDELGVELKREETGKLFPVTDDAHTVLNALLREAHDVGAELRHPWRVAYVRRSDDAEHPFQIVPEIADPDARVLRARRVILATGGMALPRSGSDGQGYTIARDLGHTTTSRIVPALVPLLLGDRSAFIKQLSGLTLPATIELASSTGKKLTSFTNSTLCTHFGLSGPSVLDISRYWTEARHADAGATLTINWVPGKTTEAVDLLLASTAAGPTVGRALLTMLPERLVRAVCERAGVEFAHPIAQLKRESRRTLAVLVTRCPLDVTGDRGFTFAEVTAGGVPLSEIQLTTMESRVCPGLHLCGEICDVDGRIGGFNFQWAWASGYIAGQAAAAAVAPAQ